MLVKNVYRGENGRGEAQGVRACKGPCKTSVYPGAWIVINYGGRNKNSVLERINHAVHIRAARQGSGKNEWSK
jgi:hypothetical protein